jgi:hypothetical protein
MDLSTWLVAELDDTVARWSNQVVGLVPAGARRDRLPEANSIDWATFHVARHAALALRVVGADLGASDAVLESLDASLAAPSAGLHEVQQPVLDLIDTSHVDRYASAVFEELRNYLGGIDSHSITAEVDVVTELERIGLDSGQFGWLYNLWATPNGFLVRWPMIGHITHHVGEMISLRNQMGLSPFR